MNPEEIKKLQDRIHLLETDHMYLVNLLRQYNIPYELPSVKKFVVPQESTPHTAVPHVWQINSPTPSQLQLFADLFQGRKDVYARLAMLKTGSAYFPVCENFWKYQICPKTEGKRVRCQECENRKWKALTTQALQAHLEGKSEKCADVVGIYPITEEEMCHFLVFDFDNHGQATDTTEMTFSWKEEVDSLRTVCRENQVNALVERSRSGKGAHVWLFFEEAVPAAFARQFGTLLLTKGAQTVNQKNFNSYDRMIPAQDHVQAGGLGNLVALPLQGQAVRNGNSVFIDEQWRPYDNQWEVLASVRKISKAFLEEKIKLWGTHGPLGILAERTDTDAVTAKPWETPVVRWNKSHALGTIQITESNMLFIDTAMIKPPLQNQIRRLAAFSNPEFYKKQAMGFSTLGIPRIVFCGYDQDGYICIPRGCKEPLLCHLEEAGITYQLTDHRQCGRKINILFKGKLYPQQQQAVDTMLRYENGVLEAATAFGKTVVGAYLIANRQVNTLILVHNKEILKNWQEDLNKFLDINEPIPQYTTPTGRVRNYPSAIGSVASGQHKATGIVDVAMIASLGKNEDILELVKNYGMIIMDECHHAGAATAMNVLREVTAQYVYGLTATPKRNDGQEQKVFMQLGPVRYRYTTQEHLATQEVAHYIYPRFTRLVHINENKLKINEAYQLAITNEERNSQIVEDVKSCLRQKRTPLVLTRFKEHADYLYEQLKNEAAYVFLLYGGSSAKAKNAVREQMRMVPEDQSMVLIATGQYIGEGFNLPRLDTLMLATPISWQGNVEQYAGRLHRDYQGKKEVVIYDYVDSHIGILEVMYHRRLRTYKKMGYQVLLDVGEKQQTNAIFDRHSYLEVFDTDLRQAQKEIIISSPRLNEYQVKQLLKNVVIAQQKGAAITIITLVSAKYTEKRTEKIVELIELLKQKGITVQLQENMHEHYAIIDQEIVWYGSMNLLAYAREDDNLMRVKSFAIAQELILRR